MSRLTGKVVIVTGSGTGIGRAIALRAAAEGAAVVIHDRLAELVPPAVAAVEAAGARAVPTRPPSTAPSPSTPSRRCD